MGLLSSDVCKTKRLSDIMPGKQKEKGDPSPLLVTWASLHPQFAASFTLCSLLYPLEETFLRYLNGAGKAEILKAWFSSLDTMETNGSDPNSYESQPSNASNTASEEKPTENDVFVNHAEVAWHEMRREWIGDVSQRPHRAPREPIMSWTTTYDDLLLSTEPFQQPIPLAEMVDFLVDIWLEEGLYD
ncbi:hypothetical protein FNV43_RR15728 [Rhamnella rubrinervis]|uniref:Gag1-like clamp domain-containing protein n=1 Tax=Rhamnella rubrinervis TaxID=2594499 RepID=A0A8K0E8C5_9ROSA|nr:hypothetical protein FNV43_RR15728 [Rhamnella rubrinervis]